MASGCEEVAFRLKKSLVGFIKQHCGQDVESAFDDILVTYISGMLEPEALEDSFDVDELREMLAAYFPEVDQISDVQLSQWAHDTSDVLASMDDTSSKGSTSPPSSSIMSFSVTTPQVETESLPEKPRNRHTSSGSDESDREPTKTKIDEAFLNEEAIHVLTEMFPHKNAIRIRKCVGIANGNLDTAAQLLLQDDGLGRDELLISSTQTTPKTHVDAKTLREQIINKYAYIDADECLKEHKPVINKVEPKKLIRYRDSKVVSVKGERFTMEQKRQEDEN